MDAMTQKLPTTGPQFDRRNNVAPPPDVDTDGCTIDDADDVDDIDPDDDHWDAFLADEDELDPEPELGDFWPEDG
jgi:hypothetical protein